MDNYFDPISVRIKKRLIEQKIRYHASDNISKVLFDGDKAELIAEITSKFEQVLGSLVIDTVNDPNSQGTAKRLAKMYINEIMAGRYDPMPPVASFPNISDANHDKYQGMLVVRTELHSVCSHHHQPVKGTCYIGILPSDKVIGLSKYSRIAQWCARRGTLQEELVQEILNKIKAATDCRDVGVYIEAVHGCCENRGIMSGNSMTQTTALSGQFFSSTIKSEFFANIKLQKMRT